MQEKIPPQVEKVEKVSQRVQGDKFANVERGNEVPMVHLELTNRKIREDLVALARVMTT